MTEVAYRVRLDDAGLMGTPASAIVNRPGFELWRHTATSHDLVTQLCQNFHNYGRTNGWQWTQDVGNNGGHQLGRPLIAGTPNATNCGGFNASVRWIASNILILPDLLFTNEFTNDRFITRTGSIRCVPAYTAAATKVVSPGNGTPALSSMIMDGPVAVAHEKVVKPC
jgi:hypothetical protein